MTGPEERLQEVMLEEALGGARPPDLERRILAGRRRSRRWVAGAVAAAALLVIAVGAYLWITGGEEPAPPRPPAPPALVCAAGMQVWAEGVEGESRTELQPGQVAVVAPGRRVEWPGGGVFQARAQGLFHYRPGGRLAFLLGSVRLTGGGRVLGLGEGELLAAPESRLEIDALPAAALNARPTDLGTLAPRVLGGGLEPYQVLVVRVMRGQATFRWKGERWPVEAGKVLSRLRGQPPKVARPVDKDALKRSQEWSRMILTGGPEQRGRTVIRMLAHLRGNPAEWEYVRGWMIQPPLADPDPALRNLLLTLRAHDPSPGMQKLLMAELASLEPRVRDGLLLQLAEAGHAPAEQALRRRLLSGDLDDSLTLPAAWFALRGEGRWRELVEWFVEDEDLLAEQPATYMACAAALHHLGSRTTWLRVLKVVRDRTLADLAAGRLARARLRVLRLDHFKRPLLAGRTPRLGDLEVQVRIHERLRAKELGSAEKVRARLDELTR